MRPKIWSVLHKLNLEEIKSCPSRNCAQTAPQTNLQESDPFSKS